MDDSTQNYQEENASTESNRFQDVVQSSLFFVAVNVIHFCLFKNQLGKEAFCRFCVKSTAANKAQEVHRWRRKIKPLLVSFHSQPSFHLPTRSFLGSGGTEFLGGSGSKWVRESHFSVSVCSPHRLWNRLVGLKLPFWLQRRRLWNQKSAPFVLLVQPCR